MKIAIKPDKKRKAGIAWTACEPFIDNTCAYFIHRVKHVTTHQISPKYKPHIAVHCLCGNSMTGTKKFTFLAAPQDGRLVCGRCEDVANRIGLPSSSELAGKQITTGRMVAVKT